MRWILLDVALVLVALGLLVGAGLGLWRHVRVLSAAVGTAGRRVGELLAVLDSAGSAPRTAPVATPAGHVRATEHAGPGVASNRPT